MAINIDSSFEVDGDGYSITDDNGNVLSYFASGAGDPTGSDAPLNSWYFRTDNRLIYYKFGAGLNDWRQIRADDIAYDVSNLILNSPDLTGLTQSKEVIDALAFRNFGKLYSFGGADPNTISAGTVVEAASTAPVDVADSGQIDFRANWSFRQRNSKSNTSGRAEILWRSDQNPGGLALDQSLSLGTTYSTLGGGAGEQTVGFGQFSFTGPQTNIEVYATIERIAGNGSAWINSIRMELWRI